MKKTDRTNYAKEMTKLDRLIGNLDWRRGQPPKDKIILLRAGKNTPPEIAFFTKEAGWNDGGFWSTVYKEETEDGYLLQRNGTVSHGEVTEQWEWWPIVAANTQIVESNDLDDAIEKLNKRTIDFVEKENNRLVEIGSLQSQLTLEKSKNHDLEEKVRGKYQEANGKLLRTIEEQQMKIRSLGVTIEDRDKRIQAFIDDTGKSR